MENEILLAIDLSVTCADGSKHDDVTMKIINNETIYLTKNNENLIAAQQVVKINSGKFVEPLIVIGLAIDKYKEQNL